MDEKSNQMLQGVDKATEVAFCFDTTGSMAPCINEVRSRIEELCEAMFTDIPNLRIGMIAHGDYCDGERCISILPLTNDKAAIFKFIRTASATGGGDADECYELALWAARNCMGWSKDNKSRVVIMAGDCAPHETGYSVGFVRNTLLTYLSQFANTSQILISDKLDIDWRQELSAMSESHIRVVPFECLHGCGFWDALAEHFKTPKIRLSEWEEAALGFSAAAYAAAGSAAYDRHMTRNAEEYKGGSVNLVHTASLFRGMAKEYDKPEGE